MQLPPTINPTDKAVFYQLELLASWLLNSSVSVSVQEVLTPQQEVLGPHAQRHLGTETGTETHLESQHVKTDISHYIKHKG